MSIKNRFYLASPLFTAKEKDRILEVSTYLRSLGYEVYSPMEHTVPNAWSISNSDWAKAVFEEDVRELDASDKVIVIYDGLYSDTGTAWEVGYAYAKGKKIYILCNEDLNEKVRTANNSTLSSLSIGYASKSTEASLMMINGCYTAIYYNQFREYDFEKDEKIVCDVKQK